jgi:aldose 1-epimerase
MLILRSGASSAVVAPDCGGGLTGWMIGLTPILRRALPQASVGGDTHAMGCLPILPYCNRVSHGRFRWMGLEYRLKPNFGDDPHTIHGVGWQCGWQVAAAGPGFVSLVLDHAPDDAWPFGFAARVTYALSETALTIGVALTNRHSGPAPAGIGVHPYFPKSAASTLRFNASGAWENGADSLPSRHGAVAAEWAHSEPRPVVDSRLDNCFTGWDRVAEIGAGSANLRIEASEAFRHLQVFTPSWADFFCVEPVSHVPDAVNRPGLPADQAMHVLEPDETLGGTVRLTVGGPALPTESEDAPEFTHQGEQVVAALPLISPTAASQQHSPGNKGRVSL